MIPLQSKVGFLTLSLFLGFSSIAPAVPVSFQVNMGIQQTLGNFNPENDMVVASGEFNGWALDFMLEKTPTNASVYSGTFDVTSAEPGGTVQYKFVIPTRTPANWESGNNRSFVLESSDQTLPLVYFNNLSNANTDVTVTFQVNMGVQQELGSFLPENGDFVSLAGDFNNWNPANVVLTNVPGTNIYSGSVKITTLAPGSSVSFKFLINGSNWESIPNRTFVLSNANQTLPVEYFNNISTTGVTVPVTFQLNMGVQIAQTNFNPETDTITVAGSFNGWNATAMALSKSPTNSALYSGTFDINSEPGTAFEFKFVMNGANWETIANRNFILEDSSQTLPWVYFNDVLPPVPNLGMMTTVKSPNQIVINWTAQAGARLQSSPSLEIPNWQDVANTEGQGSSTVNSSASMMFFRLWKP